MLGRTHGQAAVPITFGLKVAVWLDELRRHLNRLDEATPRIAVGKFLGAVGTVPHRDREPWNCSHASSST